MKENGTRVGGVLFGWGGSTRVSVLMCLFLIVPLPFLLQVNPLVKRPPDSALLEEYQKLLFQEKVRDGRERKAGGEEIGGFGGDG